MTIENEFDGTPGRAETRRISRTTVRPMSALDLLSQREMASLANANAAIHELFRRCALAILNTDGETDDARSVYDTYADFDVNVIPEPRGLKLELFNAPAEAFVDGTMIAGIRSHLFAALRDIVFTEHKINERETFDLSSGEGITDTVFRILRNAGVVRSDTQPGLIVCWGGHSISRTEYDYSKNVGYSLGLRGFDICTGCGAGAMKGPMKGAAIAHAKQLKRDSRYVGISEPGIIAAESPNAIVNELVILPDIEKRLEAFVRVAHGIIIFPGGVGTAEEILFLLGLKLHPRNADIELPLIFTGPAENSAYFEQIDTFLRMCLGDDVAEHYQIITGDPANVARATRTAVKAVRRQRITHSESFSYCWNLHIPDELQQPFIPTHDNMAGLKLHRDQPQHLLIAELRRAFSGIVAGNVKDFGVRAIEAHGPYRLHGEGEIIDGLAGLLHAFVRDGRMKIDPGTYKPCFELAAGKPEDT
ncbi:decarboxylase family protein [Luminiphilus syltensis NOR5-1B]|uniref:AMP nucleosidase n=1 Tax=Luminiphilus syltensis NOR5-1B TaxID=565045 RepID=B8KS25_9GAMM|nr:nucleotide 5'-monophosphate nucleosidase PpnN [Luminiphilus syltensis]EED34577.1 decarboxylase family protein [Luminiphilus syltensis NOR5-1B]